jgi:prepilin-type N-terminal cleavage/methylation domain-containing protein
MRNRKGFTLMELLVALFIGGMVTIALVSVWRAVSIQTSQGQRQAIVRNNMSIFLRMLYKDLTEADVILYPNTIGSVTGGLLFMSGYNMKLIEGNNVAVGRASDGLFKTSVLRSYRFDSDNHRICLNENRTPFGGELVGQDSDDRDVVNKSIIDSSIAISALISNNSTGCGQVVMDNVNGASNAPSVTLLDDENNNCTSGKTCNRYKVSINIFRDFVGGNSVPVNINFERIFTSSGGA